MELYEGINYSYIIDISKYSLPIYLIIKLYKQKLKYKTKGDKLFLR